MFIRVKRCEQSSIDNELNYREGVKWVYRFPHGVTFVVQISIPGFFLRVKDDTKIFGSYTTIWGGRCSGGKRHIVRFIFFVVYTTVKLSYTKVSTLKKSLIYTSLTPSEYRIENLEFVFVHICTFVHMHNICEQCNYPLSGHSYESEHRYTQLFVF